MDIKELIEMWISSLEAIAGEAIAGDPQNIVDLVISSMKESIECQ